MSRFLYGFLGILVGVLFLKYTYRLLKFFGHDPDAERIFSGGLGGTGFAIKMIGLAVVVGSFFYMFGIFG